MGKMFITKYKNSISKDLMRINEMKFIMNKGGFAQFAKQVHIRSAKTLNDGTNTIDATNGVNLAIHKQFYASEDNTEVYLSNKYKLTFVNTDGIMDINDLKYSTSITTLKCSTSATGDISLLSNLTSLTSLSLGGTSVTGDISSLSNLTSLTSLSLYNTSVTGELSAIKGLDKLKVLNIYDTKIIGTVSDLGLSADTTAISLGSNITGDLSFADAYPKLGEIVFKGTSITHTDAQVKALRDKGVTVSIY